MKSEDLTERVTFRLHLHDKTLLMKLLKDMTMSTQEFGSACTDAFLRGDPHMMKALADWQLLNEIPKDHRDRYTLSQRERKELLLELEAEEKSKQPKGQ